MVTQKVKRLLLPLTLSVLLLTTLAVALAEPPSRPLTVYGTAKINGVLVPNGTPIEAYIDGVALVATAVTTDTTPSGYLLDVPGDDPATPAKDGGTPGDVVTFTVDARPADQTVVWRDGRLVRVDLNASFPTLPTAGFSANPISAEINQPVQFTDRSSDPDGTIVSWVWDFDDGASSTQRSPSHSYATAGTFDVVLTVIDDDGNSDDFSRTIMVNPAPPVANFAAMPNPALVGESIDFFDLSSDLDSAIAAWGWAFGDGATSAQQDPTHAYVAPGIFDVTLVVTDSDGLTDTTDAPITVLAAPAADFNAAPNPARAGETVLFSQTATDADGAILLYAWDFGDGASSGEANPPHSYATPGVQPVQLTVTDDDGLTGTVTLPVTVTQPLVADFSVTPDPAATNSATQFDDLSTDTLSTITGWTWDFGDGNGSNEPNPTHVYTTFGTFSVTLTVEDALGYVDSAEKALTVQPRPTATFDYAPPTPAVGAQVTFTDTSSAVVGSIAAWAWDFDDGTTSVATDPTHAFGAVGPHNVRLTVTDTQGLADTTVTTLLVTGSNQPPTATLIAPAAADEGDLVELSGAASGDADGTISQYMWDLDDDGAFDDATGVTATVTFPDDSAPTVRLRVVDNEGGRDDAAATITVHNVAPVVDAGAPLTTVVGLQVDVSATFTDAGSADSHAALITWGDGAQTLLAAVTSPFSATHTYTTDGAFVATVCVDDDDGDTGCDDVSVGVLPADLISATLRDEVWLDADGSLDATPGDMLAYTLAIENVGALAAAAVTVSDTFDAALQLLGDTLITTQGSGTYYADAFELDLGTLQPGERVTVTFDAIIADPLPLGSTDAANQATVSGANFVTTLSDDPDTPALDDATVTSVNAAALLTLSTDDGAAQAFPGDYLVYRLTAANMGNAGATGLILRGTVPSSTTFRGADYNGTRSGSTVTWSVGDLAAGDQLQRMLLVQINSGTNVPTLTHSAELSATIILTDTDETAVGYLPDLTVVDMTTNAAADPQTLLLDETIPVDVSNIGRNDAILPFSLTVFSDDDRDGAFGPSDTVLGATEIASLADGADLTADVTLNGTLPFRNGLLYGFVDSGLTVSEVSEGNNLLNTANVCRATPPPPSFDGVIEYEWPSDERDFPAPDSYQSASTPLVANLNDDNGDGVVDGRDRPDLIFTTYRWNAVCDPLTFQCFWRIDQQRIRAVDGATGDLLFTIAPNNQYLDFSRSALAVGDVDNDGLPEIVVPDIPFSFFSRNRLFVYENDGTYKYTSWTFRARPAGVSPITRYSQPLIADLDGDDTNEIVVGATVFNGPDGSRRWERHLGMGYAGQDAAISLAADIDFDGQLEIITGNTIYRHDGSVFWHDDTLTDGYPAVGNFDSDRFLEFAVVRGDKLRLHDHTGNQKWQRTLTGVGGVPTVGDFDGDGSAEIAVAGGDWLHMYEANGDREWRVEVDLADSVLPGAAAFDFDGDGRDEIVFRDRKAVRIFQGNNGSVLFESDGSAQGHVETPTIADWDGDGSAEIITSHDLRANFNSNINPITGETTFFGDLVRSVGVRVTGHPSWQDTLPTWLQHAYVPPFDGLVPELTRGQPAIGLPTAAADLSVSYLRLDSDDYPNLDVIARIGNGGSATVDRGVAVYFYDGDPDLGGDLIGTVPTQLSLAGGDFEDVRFRLPGIITTNGDVWATVDKANAHIECREDNNAHSFTYDLTDLGLVAVIDNGVTTVNDGDTLTYTLLLANLSVNDATGTTVESALSDHLNFVDASDGGSLSGDEVVFPAFTLSAFSFVTRTVTAQVDPAVPLAVREISATVTIADDGGSGPDPTPANNGAVDVDRVLTVAAKPGDPYLADEGDTVMLDASASYDRNGTIVLYEWDVDGDGVYETTGVTATLTLLDDRDIPLKLRVTDNSGEQDVATTPLRFNNVPPLLTLGPDRTVVEGSQTSISPTLFSDAGVLDTHTVWVDWDDGFMNSGLISETLGAGEASAVHVYPDDGVYGPEVCVRDDDGGETCQTLTITVTNAAPGFELGFFDLTQWTAEGLNGGGTADWQVAPDGQVVTQTVNNGVAFFYGPYSAFDNRSEVIIRKAQSGDNDYIGFVLGFAPNDSVNSNADYLLLSWKQATQSFNSECGNQTAQRGLALSRVSGVPAGAEFWALDDLDCTPPEDRVTELARGLTLGSATYQQFRDYHFTFEYGPDQVRIWVDDVLQFDVEGDFPPGRLGYYNYSQANVVYSNVYLSQIHVDEGRVAELVAPFGDKGAVDTHTVEIDWDDGAIAPADAVLQQPFGGGIFTATHIFRDNGAYLPLVCVTDDELDTGCDTITTTVRNVAPSVYAGVDITQQVTEPVTLDLGQFFDPGALDTFTTTVAWGDSSSDSGTATPVDSSVRGVTGTLTFPSHTYTQTNLYDVSVCVTDDDGGTGCDTLFVNLGEMLVEIVPSNVLTEGVETMFTAVYTDFESAEPYTFTWQFDAAGLFANTGTVTETHTFVQDGRYEVRLGVENGNGTQGFAVLPVQVDNAPPQVDAGTEIVVTETESADLNATFTDLGIEDTHSYVITWDDGAIETGAATSALGSGSVSSSHVYADDGAYLAEICITDGDGGAGCDTVTITVNNAPPIVEYYRFVDFRAWDVARFNGGNATWQVLDDGLTVRQTQDTAPSVFYGIPQQDGLRVEATLQFEPDNDNDFGGFVVGYDPGEDGNPLAEYFLIDWRQTNQLASTCRGSDNGARGLALSRVFGTPLGGEYWHHSNTCDPDEWGVEPLARAFTLGSTGYVDGVDYRFVFEFSAEFLRVYVDGVLEFDQSGDFTNGQFALYAFSQDKVRFSEVAVWYPEGQMQRLETLFSEINAIDTHTATVQWQGSPTETVTISPTATGGTFISEYLYPDNGAYAVRTCAEDDDGGRDCRIITATVSNLPPRVTATPDRQVPYQTAFSLRLATFTDPGIEDTHTVIIDWGDGTITGPAGESLPLLPIDGTHTYAASGVYTVTITVTDDDGGVGSDTLVLDASLDPTAVREVHVSTESQPPAVLLVLIFLLVGTSWGAWRSRAVNLALPAQIAARY